MDAGNGIDWTSPDYVGETPSHTFTKPGLYVVTLRVTDSKGNSEIGTVNITVTQIPTEETVPNRPTGVVVYLMPENDKLPI